MTGGELVQHVADIYSISPRLILAMLEYQTGALTQPNSPDPGNLYPLGYYDVYASKAYITRFSGR